MYNSFTSIGAKIDDRIIRIMGSRGIYSFRIYGEMYHSIGNLLPNDEEHPQFAQIYIYDTNVGLRK